MGACTAEKQAPSYAGRCAPTAALQASLISAALRGAGAGSVLADFLDTSAVVEKLWATAMPFNPSTH